MNTNEFTFQVRKVKYTTYMSSINSPFKTD